MKKTCEKLLTWSCNEIMDMTLREQATKAKINKWNHTSNERASAEKNQQHERATYGMGENICRSHIQ